MVSFNMSNLSTNNTTSTTTTTTTPVELLQMDFEGLEAVDSDIPSMSRLLNQLVRESGVNSEQLAKVLVSQNYVGSVLKPCPDDMDIDEDDESPEDQPVFAITSLINLTDRQEPVVKEVLGFIRKLVRETNVKVEKDRSVFDKVANETGDGIKLGLLIKERMINMPVDLLHPSLESLVSDVGNAIRKNMPYKLTHFLYWSKMYVDKDVFHHYDVEDSWFEENCHSHISYPLKFADTVMIQNEETTTGALPIRRIYMIEIAKLQSFIDHVKVVTQSNKAMLD